MKKVIFAFCALLFFVNSAGAKSMEQEIKNSVIKLFVHTDQREWNALKEVFTDQVLLDYSSFTQSPASELTSDQIVTAWSGFLPGFASTQHQITNMLVKQTGNKAQVFCYGSASHYFPNDSGNNVWIVVGTYDFKLTKTAGYWKVSAMKFNFKYQDGNTDLPNLIQ